MNKRAQLQISFGMIFSILLIIIFVVFAFFGIKKFMDVQNTILVNKFIDDLDNDVAKMWESSRGSQEVKYTLPKKIQEVCFKEDNKENVYFISKEDFDGGRISYVNYETTLDREEETCFNVENKKVSFVIDKTYGEDSVTISKEGRDLIRTTIKDNEEIEENNKEVRNNEEIENNENEKVENNQGERENIYGNCESGCTESILITGKSYYVSSSLGNDNNNGLSQDTAFKTLSKVKSLTLLPGDGVLLKRGDSWNEMLIIDDSGSLNNKIYYSTYSSGNKPKINFKGNTYEGCVSIKDENYITIDNLDITGGCSQGVYLKNTGYITIQNSYIHHINSYEHKVGIWMGAYSSTEQYDYSLSAKHTKILNNEIAYTGYDGIYGTSEYSEIAYNKIYNIDMLNAEGDSIQLNCYSPYYYIHNNFMDKRGNNGYKGLIMSSHGVCENHPVGAPYYSNTYGIVEHNLCYAGQGDSFGIDLAGDNDIVRYNILIQENGPIEPLEKGHAAILKPTLAHHNIIKGYNKAFYLRGGRPNVFNNLIIDVWRGVDSNQANTGADIEFRNNILVDVDISWAIASGVNFQESNNLILTKTQANDLFVDFLEGDYHLKSSSINAIDKGREVSLTKDFYGNLINSNPDIGIHEYS